MAQTGFFSSETSETGLSSSDRAQTGFSSSDRAQTSFFSRQSRLLDFLRLRRVFGFSSPVTSKLAFLRTARRYMGKSTIRLTIGEIFFSSNLLLL